MDKNTLFELAQQHWPETTNEKVVTIGDKILRLRYLPDLGILQVCEVTPSETKNSIFNLKLLFSRHLS